MSSNKGRDRLIRDDPKEERRGSSYERRFDEPRHLNCRIAVSNLDDKVSREALEDRFSKYGRVNGTSMHRGFAYVQFEMEDAAQVAVKQENETLFAGSKIDVRLAKDNRREEKPHFISTVRRRSPPSKRDYARDSYYRPAYRERSPPRGGREVEDMFRRDDPPSRNHGRSDDRYRDSSPSKRDAPGSSSRSYGSFYEHRPDQRSPQPFRSRDPPGSFADPPKPPQLNECEIIVTSKLLRPYAESVLWKLKAMGMAVDLLFPKEDTPLMQILEAITARGCLYALVITSQNEVHKSLTVNILYGAPQEHRNMPLEDAMLLINRNYDNYKIEKAANLKLGSHDLPTPVIPPAVNSSSSSSTQLSGTRVPPINTGLGDTQLLFRLLAEGKQLTVPEFDRVIQHLQECRDRLVAAEGGGAQHSNTLNVGAPSEKMVQHVGNLQQSDVQQKIMNLIGNNQSATNRASVPQVSVSDTYDTRSVPANNDWRMTGVPAVGNTNNGQTLPSQGSSATFINFDNPSIKKALDSLIQSGPSLLRTLEAASSSSGPVAAVPRVGSSAGAIGGGGAANSSGGVGAGGEMGNMYGNPYAAGMQLNRNMGALNSPGLGNMGALNSPGLGNMGALNNPGLGNMGALNSPGLGNMGALNSPGLGNMGALHNPGLGNMGALHSSGLGNMGALHSSGLGNMGALNSSGLRNIGPPYSNQGSYQRPYF